jgi:hypothetical protein
MSAFGGKADMEKLYSTFDKFAPRRIYRPLTLAIAFEFD